MNIAAADGRLFHTVGT